MSSRRITTLTDVALITCVVEKGLADTLVEAARDEGATGATVYYARGSGVRERLGVLGVAVEAEKEVVDIVVAAEQVDRVFDRLYLVGQLDTPGKGFLYVTSLDKAATYVPPSVLARLTEEGS